jgi:hypothetical protein
MMAGSDGNGKEQPVTAAAAVVRIDGSTEVRLMIL